MINSNVSNVFLENKKEREELLLIKSIMVWIKFRFNIPMKFYVKKEDQKYVKALQDVDNLLKVAIISTEDAWGLEKNAFLINIIGRKFLQETVTDDLFEKYGSVITACNRMESLVNIALVSTVDKNATPQVMPCSLVIMKNEDIVTQFKKTETVLQPNHVDIIPFLKIKIPSLLSKPEIKLIENIYYEYKDTVVVVRDRDRVVSNREAEVTNLKAITKIVNPNDTSVDITKLAISLYALVIHSYTVDPQRISKIRYGSGGASPVMDFSRLYYVTYGIDLGIIKEILDPIIDPNMHIRVHGDRILFTTGRYDPTDDIEMEAIASTTFDSAEAVDQLFNARIGTMASVADVKKILKQVMIVKYNK